ncbi:hypothetical protein [Paracidovorax sp. MALMAid1276]|uniref:hypothetical protein n=1 Tax=Paracidovorax sp. MALMAid1276 TaxID=3411631 RepID=UPI003B9CCDDA
MDLETALSHVEEQVQAVSAALLATDAPALERSGTALRHAASDLAQVLSRTDPASLPPSLAQRLQAVSSSVAMQRDNLARVAALTDRQVATVLPPTDASTYGARPGNGAARIYKAAG